MKSAFVFFMSLLAALVVLAVERFAGIDWDFHPDSVTYATTAADVVASIWETDKILFFNNAYYFWANLLDMNISLMISANILMYAITNVCLMRYHDRFSFGEIGQARNIVAMLILLFNPYRLHLATTLLKDTMIILTVVLVADDKLRRVPLLILPMLALRLASVLYLTIKLRRKALMYVLVVGIVLCAIFSDLLADRLNDFNSADMQLRDFDQVPNFREFGLLGVLLRALTWPILGVTGVFAVISPAAAFFPVALGALLNQLYCYLMTKRLAFPFAVIVPMAVFGAMVTGYTAYIRYTYPLLVVLPIVALLRQRQAALAARPLSHAA